MELNSQQKAALELLDTGQNVLLTGVAGTGKTLTLNAWLEKVKGKRKVAVTAYTGVAAQQLSGTTLSSWIGQRPEVETVEQLCNKSWYRRKGRAIRKIDTLVIDEISMVDASLFGLAEAAHALACSNDMPWGGIQIVLVGDFGQLPPVECETKGWCFQDPAWARSEIKKIELLQVMRQDDARFVDMLRRIRVGVIDDEIRAALQSRIMAYDPDGPGVVRLVTHVRDAERINDKRLADLPGQEVLYRATDWADPGHEYELKAIEKSCLSPKDLKLKQGARVMFTKNDPERRWVNGTVGTVVGFSKVPSPKDMFVLEDVIHVELKGKAVVAVRPATWDRRVWSKLDENGEPLAVAGRTQYPLQLAWAITIHKSQGSTLELASIDLTHAFAPGQAYVALSRCKTLEGINIEGISSGSIRAHPIIRAHAARILARSA